MNAESTNWLTMNKKMDKQALLDTLNQLVDEWLARDILTSGQLFVVGTSTSEVLGDTIGTTGSVEVAEVIFKAMQRLKKETGVQLAFQCCEHLNRALIVERETMMRYDLSEVTVVPHPHAGGSMATYSYHEMDDAVVVESLQAHAGIDIGETMIGMHLKAVAVPLRFKTKQIGKARVTGAYTRPKLIGGERAIYR